MRDGVFGIRWLGLFSWVIVVLIFSLPLVGEGKKKRRAVFSPVKILNVVTAPDPFVIGQSPLTISMVVQLPSSLKGAAVLEVSTLITSPTRRSMSFVTNRLLLGEEELKGHIPTFPVELTWDGKDQHDQFVADGSYLYEIQAKLMKDQGDGPRTKIVSRRVHGILEALAYVGEVLPPVLPEQDLPEDLEQAREEVLTENDLPLGDEELAVSDEPTLIGEKQGGKSVDVPSDAVEAPLSDLQEEEQGGESYDEPTSEEPALESTDQSILESLPASEEAHSDVVEDPIGSSPDKKNEGRLEEEKEKDLPLEEAQISEPTNERLLEQATVSEEASSAR